MKARSNKHRRRSKVGRGGVRSVVRREKHNHYQRHEVERCRVCPRMLLVGRGRAILHTTSNARPPPPPPLPHDHPPRAALYCCGRLPNCGATTVQRQPCIEKETSVFTRPLLEHRLNMALLKNESNTKKKPAYVSLLTLRFSRAVVSGRVRSSTNSAIASWQKSWEL